MPGSMFMGGSDFPRATYVGSAYQPISGGAPANTTLNLAALGAAAGDYCMIFEQGLGEGAYSRVTSDDGIWTQDNYTWTPQYGYACSTFLKKLTTTDLAGTIYYTNLGNAGGGGNTSTHALIIVIYRGASSAVRKTLVYDDDGGTTHTTPGYSRSYNNVGTVGLIADRDTAGTVTAAVSGGTITERLEQVASNFHLVLVDALPTADYPSGVAVTWSGLGNSGPYGEVSQLYELLG